MIDHLSATHLQTSSKFQFCILRRTQQSYNGVTPLFLPQSCAPGVPPLLCLLSPRSSWVLKGQAIPLRQTLPCGCRHWPPLAGYGLTVNSTHAGEGVIGRAFYCTVGAHTKGLLSGKRSWQCIRCLMCIDPMILILGFS